MASETIANERADTAAKLADIRRQIAEDRAAIRAKRLKMLHEWKVLLSNMGLAISDKVALRDALQRDLANLNLAVGLTAKGNPRKPRTSKTSPNQEGL
jgi:hypothetical protein